MNQLAVVTGGGSGVGQATVLALVSAGWSVAALGRRLAALEETRSLAGSLAGRVIAIECDIAQQESVRKAARRIESELGSVEVLVNAAGTNAPERALEVLSDADYRLMMDTNLNGAYYCVQAFLPGMRNRSSTSSPMPENRLPPRLGLPM
jgi:NAD(P)-dependent dehydrogenase (short-subunit alcohol dehydrogenase family)